MINLLSYLSEQLYVGQLLRYNCLNWREIYYVTKVNENTFEKEWLAAYKENYQDTPDEFDIIDEHNRKCSAIMKSNYGNSYLPIDADKCITIMKFLKENKLINE
jgi:hypothetical protein